ncbi:DRAP deaminase [Rhizophlyctis rosea]|nr:DRAP deaminase [Rhizophlyctis rosea]
MTTNQDRDYMLQAIAEANKSPSSDQAYCVGALLLSPGPHPTILSTGYSRELPGNTHAEEVCLLKLPSPTLAHGATIYTTMEPCGLRLSGKTPCANLLLEAKIGRVVMGVKEPPNFVAECSGAASLRSMGVVVDHVEGLEEECLAPNKHLFSK